MKPDYQINDVKLYNLDCMEFMNGVENNFYDLAIVDPEYGIGESKKKRENTKSDKWKNPTQKIHNPKDWDLHPPPQKYFDELFRISENQIIWGGNYFIDKIKKPSMGWIFWDKKNGNSDFSDGELAFTSFKKGLRKFEWLWNGFQKEKPETRIHITQKPVALYKWLLLNYAKKGDKIFDSHGGSFSSACACLDMGFDFDGCEIDKEYFDNAVERLKNNNQLYMEF